MSPVAIFQDRLWRLGAPLGLIVLVGAAFAMGYFLRGGPSHMTHGAGGEPQTSESASPADDILYWTCSMHPQIKQPGPGQCPLCGMDLIPVRAGAGDEGAPRVFATTEQARALLDIQTVPVERRFVEAEIRMVGKVAIDETRLAHVTAWVPGRLDKMYVDYTGMKVRAGDHMAELYSPQLLTAQAELRRAQTALARLDENSPAIIRQTAATTLDAARSKLRRWGLTEEQVAQAQAAGSESDHVVIYSPVGGTVIERMGREGMYVEEGTRIYTIADLDELWVLLDAYESDLMWLHYGQKVTFTTEAHPGQVFEGRISFIEPILNQQTRTVKVRVNVPNPEGKLKPEMFVRAVVHPRVATAGRVMDPEISGKWICPMHPEVIEAQPGDCPLCGMDLVRAETLGYVAVNAAAQDMPLVIPVSAPLMTGERAVVYVEVQGKDRPMYEGREVALGPRAGGYYLVESGLAEGERVVVNGNFKIDSALQIQAQPSMMNPEEESGQDAPGETVESDDPGIARLEAPAAFLNQIEVVVDQYLAAQQALAADKFDSASAAAQAMREAFNKIDSSVLQGEASDAWRETWSKSLAKSLDALTQSRDIETFRAAFKAVSDDMIGTIQQFGAAGDTALYMVNCPMAFDFEGADWVQAGEDVANPYFGLDMLKCGDVTGQLAGAHEGHRHE